MELPQQQHRHHRKQNNLYQEKSRAAAQPTEQMFVRSGDETNSAFAYQGGATALSPPISVMASAKGHARGARSFANTLIFGGLSCSQREKSPALRRVTSSQVWH